MNRATPSSIRAKKQSDTNKQHASNAAVTKNPFLSNHQRPIMRVDCCKCSCSMTKVFQFAISYSFVVVHPPTTDVTTTGCDEFSRLPHHVSVLAPADGLATPAFDLFCFPKSSPCSSGCVFCRQRSRNRRATTPVTTHRNLQQEARRPCKFISSHCLSVNS